MTVKEITKMLLKDAIIQIQDSSQWAVYADSLEENADARFGQTQFENGGLLDNKQFIISGDIATRALMSYTDGDGLEWLDEHGSVGEFFDWLIEEGWIGQ